MSVQAKERCHDTESKIVLPHPYSFGKLQRSGKQLFPENPVAFQVPFTAHGIAFVTKFFLVDHPPLTSACRFSPHTRIMRRKPCHHIGRPAHIGTAHAFICQHINITTVRIIVRSIVCGADLLILVLGAGFIVMLASLALLSTSDNSSFF